MLDFIHVGDYKTGTTWMQSYAFPGHPEIHYLGDYFQNREYHRLFHELIDARDLDFDAARLRREFSKEIAKEHAQGKKIGVSREVLSQTNFITGENARRNAVRMRAVFGTTKIIYIIREQLSMIVSIYSQYVKMGGTLSLEDFVVDPIQAKGLIHRLQYDKNISMYHEIFGEENVHVGLFEEFSDARSSFLEKVYRFLGCKQIHYAPEAHDTRVNSALSRVGCFTQRMLNRFVRNPYNPSSNVIPLDKFVGMLLNRTYKLKADVKTSEETIPSYGSLDRKARILFAINMAMTHRVEKMCSAIAVGSPIRLSDGMRHRSIPLFRESNRTLVERFGLQIEKYHWVV